MDWGAIIGALVTILSVGGFVYRQVVKRRAANAASEMERLRTEAENLRGYKNAREKVDAVRIDDDVAVLRDKLRDYGRQP